MTMIVSCQSYETGLPAIKLILGKEVNMARRGQDVSICLNQAVFPKPNFCVQRRKRMRWLRAHVFVTNLSCDLSIILSSTLL